MKLIELIRQNSWLSVEKTLLKAYPNEKQNITAYDDIFNKLKLMPVIETDMIIEVSRKFDDFDKEEYIDVSGRQIEKDANQNKREVFYALEFTPWSEWIGMQIDKKTLKQFTELEIISHCLLEMTFIGFDENSIQSEMKKINEAFEEYNSLSEEEKKSLNISLDDLE